MSQLLQTRPKIYQDLAVSKDSILKSPANFASCNICGKGLENGHSLTAKDTSLGTILFCDKHYQMD